LPKSSSREKFVGTMVGLHSDILVPFQNRFSPEARLDRLKGPNCFEFASATLLCLQ